MVERGAGVVEETESGSITEMRGRARMIANAHDLVPIWLDASWIDSGTSRPPASRWESRRSR